MDDFMVQNHVIQKITCLTQASAKLKPFKIDAEYKKIQEKKKIYGALPALNLDIDYRSKYI